MLARTLAQAADAVRACSVRTADGCLRYTGRLDRDGYARVRHDGRGQFAHRVVYAAAVGPIPAGLVLDHRCHTDSASCPGGRNCPHRACLEVTHLEPVPSGVNVLRGPTTHAARNAAKTHCPRGHAYDEANTRHSRGRRVCRTCTNGRGWARRNP